MFVNSLVGREVHFCEICGLLFTERGPRERLHILLSVLIAQKGFSCHGSVGGRK